MTDTRPVALSADTGEIPDIIFFDDSDKPYDREAVGEEIRLRVEAALDDVRKGHYINGDEFFKKMREKYGYTIDE
ncbi:MAG: hypothetical protein NC078_00035 [Ruminococcus sp.]|nr:hypothetical protein [Ruminococcus sp.]